MAAALKMAWRNVWRNPRRTVLTLCAIAFAAALLIFALSLQFGSYRQMIDNAVRISTGHLQVQAASFQQEQEMRKVVPRPKEIAALLARSKGVRAYSFRAQAFNLVSSARRTYGALVIGVDPAREARVSTIPSQVRQGSFLAPGDGQAALVGRLLARNLQVGVGGELTLLGQGRDGSIAATVLKVKGIVSTGQDAFDRALLMMPLGAFDEAFFMRGAVHRVVVLADSLEAVPGLKQTLAAALAGRHLKVLDWRELNPGLSEAITLDLASGLIFYFMLIVVVAFSILNTFLMAIFERTREFGVMMALGTGPGRLVRLLMLESGLITGLGTLAGIALGCLVTHILAGYGINFGEASDQLMRQYGISGRIHPHLSLLSALAGPAAVMLITLLSALYPALKVRRLKPVEALSHV